MRLPLALAGILAASTCWAQQPLQNPLQAPIPPQSQSEPGLSSQAITVPAGTRIPLSLASPITAKTMKRGDSVRAVTDFPVTVGTQVAIPVGTYLEGAIDKVNLRGRYRPTVKMHFSRIVFPNGYTAAINATTSDPSSTQAPQITPTKAFADSSGGKFALMGQNSVSPPPLPSVGPSKAEILAIGLGATAATTVAFILLARRHAGIPANGIVFDTGWQFEAQLQSPLKLNAQSVPAAAGANAP